MLGAAEGDTLCPGCAAASEAERRAREERLQGQCFHALVDALSTDMSRSVAASVVYRFVAQGMQNHRAPLFRLYTATAYDAIKGGPLMLDAAEKLNALREALDLTVAETAKVDAQVWQRSAAQKPAPTREHDRAAAKPPPLNSEWRICPWCIKPALQSLLPGHPLQRLVCRVCHRPFETFGITVRAKRSTYYQRKGIRAFSVRVRHANGTVDLVQFCHMGWDDFELRSGDHAIFSSTSVGVKIVENLTIGRSYLVNAPNTGVVVLMELLRGLS